MTYTIKFVNFTLGTLFQNNLGRWCGVRALPALYGSYAHGKGPNVTNSICWTCKNCSYKCAADCEHFVSHNPVQSCSDNIPS